MSWTQFSFKLPRDLFSEIEETVENSQVHENPSQLIRAAIRTYLDEDAEFDQAH